MTTSQDVLSVRYEQKNVDETLMLHHARAAHQGRKLQRSVFSHLDGVKSWALYDGHVRVERANAEAEHRRPCINREEIWRQVPQGAREEGQRRAQSPTQRGL